MPVARAEAGLDSLRRPGVLQRILLAPAVPHNVSVDPVAAVSEVTHPRPCDILFVHAEADVAPSFIHDYSRGHGRFLVDRSQRCFVFCFSLRKVS